MIDLRCVLCLIAITIDEVPVRGTFREVDIFRSVRIFGFRVYARELLPKEMQ